MKGVTVYNNHSACVIAVAACPEAEHMAIVGYSSRDCGVRATGYRRSIADDQELLCGTYAIGWNDEEHVDVESPL